jgi:hypothetical protein
MDTLNKGAFDKLVAGLNSDERLSLLNKINKNTDIELQIEASDLNEKNFNLLSQYKNESSFYKFLLWLRSFFLKISKEKLYNQDLIDRFAKELSNLHPGILRHKQRLLDNYFFERLKSLKDASDFFKPPILIFPSTGKFISPSTPTMYGCRDGVVLILSSPGVA